MDPVVISGFLVWLIRPKHQHLDTLRLYLTEQWPLCFPSFRPMWLMVHQSIQQTIPQVSRHETVNHPVEFVSSTGVCTQHIESYWNRSKTRLKTMKVCRSEKRLEYLDEFMWKERVPANSGEDLEDILETIFLEIRSQYPISTKIMINESRIPLIYFNDYKYPS